MSISVFDLFKVGIGPSSSHTVGPMRAAQRFAEQLRESDERHMLHRIKIELFGSLSATGVGHGTDKAVLLGLMGASPDTIDPRIIDSAIKAVCETDSLTLPWGANIEFEWHADLLFIDEVLPYHPNAMRLTAFFRDNNTFSNIYYSVGGGFVLDEQEATASAHLVPQCELPHDFNTGEALLVRCREQGLRISQLMLENEKVWRNEDEIRSGLAHIWQVMQACISSGLENEGVLPGGLNVRRRAPSLYRSLQKATAANVISSTLSAMDWINLYALAVNEENAAGGRMVTAPTNGAAGIIPAVLMYYMQFNEHASERDVVDFLLAAAAIGALCKKNASISGAEVGCQGEVGSACAMAAAGLTEVLGGTPEQVENAAEIALEHNLGLTCDPVGGLVQVPCIERNAIAAMKAINAAQMALRGDGQHFISLDKVIRTMRDTGRDMQDKYKETSRGGLAVNAIEC
ncbi:L-serine ammonia-lyase [Mangrovibacter plantisponsor]|uniref:L-serine dehydratase n=1 Tax=Mangrovibacter plantisponsor TaxID=451513 RepID=A0A317Q9N2_9ENTR|nr:L-serine ammonia-lyase [Mangrovibacter plantisponsor]PWW12646.1 L-serine ammonia-lyase [Mangrovibacter plantisponsor]